MSDDKHPVDRVARRVEDLLHHMRSLPNSNPITVASPEFEHDHRGLATLLHAMRRNTPRIGDTG